LQIPGGPTLQNAYEWAAIALFGYMFKLDNVEIKDESERVIEVQGATQLKP